jgi:hypothetical protein
MLAFPARASTQTETRAEWVAPRGIRARRWEQRFASGLRAGDVTRNLYLDRVLIDTPARARRWKERREALLYLFIDY